MRRERREDVDLQKKKGKSKQGPQGTIFSAFFFICLTARLPKRLPEQSVPGFHMQNLIVFVDYMDDRPLCMLVSLSVFLTV